MAAVNTRARRVASCTHCRKPLSQPDELESGLCLRCLNGPLADWERECARGDAIAAPRQAEEAS